MKNSVFLLISTGLMGILDDPQSLFDELCLRTYPATDVVRLTSVEEANVLAFQRYGILFHGYQQEGTSPPMRLPVSGKYLLATAVTAAEEQALLSPQMMVSAPIDFSGVWGISALNGFGGGFGLSYMVTALLNDALNYPVARWFPNYDSSLGWARYDYVRRFYSYFAGTSISPRIPSFEQMAPGRMFVDSEFEANSKQRQESGALRRMLDVGLIA